MTTTTLYISNWLTVDEAETCIHVRPRFAGDKIFRPVTDQTEVTQCWYALTLYLYSMDSYIVASYIGLHAL